MMCEFDMITRTRQRELPPFDLQENRIVFYGSFDTLCSLPLRLDIALGANIIIGDVRQVSIHKNGKGYEAEYSYYAAHYFEEAFPL